MKEMKKYLYKGKYYTALELAGMCNISPKTMYKRLQTMTVEEAVEYVAPIKNVNRAQKFDYKGKYITVKEFCALTSFDIKTVYKKLKKGMTLEEIENYKRPKTNNVVEKRYEYNGHLLSVKEVALLENIDPDNLYRRLNQGLSIYEAVEIIRVNQTKYYPYMGKMMSIPDILRTDNNISSAKLYSMLKNMSECTEEDIKYIVSLCGKNDIYEINGVSLYQYCISNKYNYTSIYYLIKNKQFTMEEAIRYYEENGQGNTISGKYFVGNILLRHFCISEQLDGDYVINLINEGLNPYQAMIRYIFSNSKFDRTRNIELSKLYSIWEILADTDRKEFEERYKISNEEIEVLKSNDSHIKRIFKNYDLFRLSYYLDSDINQVEVANILSANNISLEEALFKIEKLYKNFEKSDSKKGIFIWKKEQ